MNDVMNYVINTLFDLKRVRLASSQNWTSLWP